MRVEGVDAVEMAHKLQDPLANIKAVMSNSDIHLNTGQDMESYGFSLQPLDGISFEAQYIVRVRQLWPT